MAKKTFMNKTDRMQVVYDESITKYEVVPGGTVELEGDVGERYGGVLKEATKEEKKDAKKDDQK